VLISRRNLLQDPLPDTLLRRSYTLVLFNQLRPVGLRKRPQRLLAYYELAVLASKKQRLPQKLAFIQLTVSQDTLVSIPLSGPPPPSMVPRTFDLQARGAPRLDLT
jgi:hypothetical protein